MDIDKMLNVLNKKSGVEGLSCVSSDFRDLETAADKGDSKAALAQQKFAYEVKKYVGAYAAAMGGVDAVIFTAGVGIHALAAVHSSDGGAVAKMA